MRLERSAGPQTAGHLDGPSVLDSDTLGLRLQLMAAQRCGLVTRPTSGSVQEPAVPREGGQTATLTLVLRLPLQACFALAGPFTEGRAGAGGEGTILEGSSLPPPGVQILRPQAVFAQPPHTQGGQIRSPQALLLMRR